jgi:hypothetical protein
MVFVRGRGGGEIVEDYDEQGNEEGVDKVVGWSIASVWSMCKGSRGVGEEGLTERNSFYFGVGERDAQVGQGEHAMEGLDEELDQEVADQEEGEADVIGSVGSLQAEWRISRYLEEERRRTCVPEPRKRCGQSGDIPSRISLRRRHGEQSPPSNGSEEVSEHRECRREHTMSK